MDAVRERLDATLLSARLTALGLVALVVLALVLAGGLLLVVGVGLVVMLAAIPLTRRLARTHRVIAGGVLQRRIDADYRTPPDDRATTLLTTWAGDPQTFRDVAWLAVCALAGTVFSLLPVLLLVGIVTIPVWWAAALPLLRLRARMDAALLGPATDPAAEKVYRIRVSKAETLDHAANELRRIERDLHDGPQARIAAIGINLGLAQHLAESDPQAANSLVAEAHASTKQVLADLRGLVRGIAPPVLVDRGLGPAVAQLALDLPVEVVVTDQLAERPPLPVESALWFAIAECLANITKHAQARHATVALDADDRAVVAVVTDDGVGGVEPTPGSGLDGVVRRLSAFDGTMIVSSPRGGPTRISLEIPHRVS